MSRCTRSSLLFFLLACVPFGLPAALDAQAPGTTGGEKLVDVLRSSPASLLDSPRNKDFMNLPLGEEQINRLRETLGKSAVDGSMALNRYSGRTIGDLLRENGEILKRYPNLMMSLVNDAQARGAPVFPNETATEPLDVSSPGRIIPGTDLKKHLLGGEGSPDRFRDYLGENFGLSPRHVDAYNVFLALSSGNPVGDTDLEGLAGEKLPGGLDGSNGLRSGLAVLGGQQGGLYLPGTETLERMDGMLKFLKEYAKAGNQDPVQFRTSDGRGLADLFEKYEADPARRPSPEALAAMSPAQVRESVLKLLKSVVQKEREGANKALIESGLALIPTGTVAPVAGSGVDVDLPEVGNGKIRALNEALYERLIPVVLPNSVRDAIELESGGDFFAIRGRMDQVKNKHYDLPLDRVGTVAGTGLSLGGKH